ncbi:unnamed protein product [Colias eurytheme]|nr:unnamed protein product [Colias eurytheme]
MDELSLRLERFRALFTHHHHHQFDDVQTRIEIENPTSMEAEIDARDEIEQDFISLIASAQRLLGKNNSCELASVKSEDQAHCGHQAIPGASSFPPASCVFCNGSHRIYDCSSYRSLSVEDRIAGAARLKLCLNCLRAGHTTYRCRLRSCRTCKKRHNTLSHREVTQAVNTQTMDSPTPTQSESGVASNHMVVSHSTQVLLCTALIDVYNPVSNDHVTARAMLDSGSMTSLITKELKHRLQLTPQHNFVNLRGVGDISLFKTPERCALQIRSIHDNNINFDISCLVLPNISGNLPHKYIDVSHLNLPRNIKLADPNFNQPGPIDILIGADIFWNLIGSEQITLGQDMPVMHDFHPSNPGHFLIGRALTSLPSPNAADITRTA